MAQWEVHIEACSVAEDSHVRRAYDEVHRTLYVEFRLGANAPEGRAAILFTGACEFRSRSTGEECEDDGAHATGPRRKQVRVSDSSKWLDEFKETTELVHDTFDPVPLAGYRHFVVPASKGAELDVVAVECEVVPVRGDVEY